MLRQLLRVMRPGGRAYVSVWATLQEDPAKTLAKWEPMQASPDPTPTQTSTESAQVVEVANPPGCAEASSGHTRDLESDPDAAAGTPAVPAAETDACCRSRRSQGGQLDDNRRHISDGHLVDRKADESQAGLGPQDPCAAGQAKQAPSEVSHLPAAGEVISGLDVSPSHQDDSSPSAGSAKPASAVGSGNDYFVPWHLPLHRARATGLLNQIPDPPDWAKPSPSEACSAGTHAPQPEDLDVTAAQLQGVRFDEKKQTLVFRRYYHLFEEAELADLVGQVEGAQVEDCFYDKSNWCVVMRKALSEP